MDTKIRIVTSLALISALMLGAAAQGQILRVAAERHGGHFEIPRSTAPAKSGIHTSDEPALHRIELAGLTPAEVERLQRAAFGTPRIIGIHRDVTGKLVDADGEESLVWKEAADGSWVSTLSIRSRGAAGLRIALEIDRLPAGVEIFFASPMGDTYPLGTLEAERLIWSPVIDGDELRVEIRAPSSVAAARVALSVAKLTHLVDSPLADKFLGDVGRSGSCNRDLACDSNRAEIGKSVAKYVFESGAFTGLCTGQLLADTDPDTDRYLFLTAAHCVSTRAEARSMSFFWHFQRAQCDGADPTSVEQTLRGARLRYTSGPAQFTGDTTDHTLVELRRPPADDVVFSGWTTEPAEELLGRTVWGVHHPMGDVKMVSKGKVKALEEGTHYEIQWRRGTTEGGSSGSGIWIGRRPPNQYLVGVLTGGFASCEDRREPDFYGQFVRTWNQSARFRRLLDPE